MNITYKIVRSKRKTVSLSVDKNCQVIVKAGLLTSLAFIDSFVNKHKDWIIKQQKKLKEKTENYNPLSKEEIANLKARAKAELTLLTQYYAKIMAVKPNGVKITSAATRWGSCSGTNSICYSYRVMLLPKECREYIVVHELSHIKVKNHSEKFYKEVEKYMPDYKNLQKIIKNYKLTDVL